MSCSKTTSSLELLASVGIFEGLPAADLEQVKSLCNDPRLYAPGKQVVSYQDATDEVFFLLNGQARVTIYSVDGKVVSFRELSPGDMFGEYPALDGGPRSASVEAKTACWIASMPARSFRDVLQTKPQVAQTLLRLAVLTIRRLTNRVYEFSTLAVNNRIHAEILRLANLSSQNNYACIDPLPTHAEIASRVSTHREAVSRELNRLAKMGIVERQAGTLVVKDVARLADMVHEATGDEE